MSIQMRNSARARSKDGALQPRERPAVRARGAGGPLLVCYDGSDDAKYAIETASTLFPGGRTLVVSVWQRLAGRDTIAWAGEPAGWSIPSSSTRRQPTMATALLMRVPALRTGR